MKDLLLFVMFSIGIIFLSLVSMKTSSRIMGIENRVSALEKPKLDTYEQALDYILQRESNNGKADNLDVPGPDGELGPWQVTPIWIDDIKRLTGEVVDPMNQVSTRRQVRIWLEHYAPRVGAESKEEMHELYRRGPTGYRRWKGE